MRFCRDCATSETAALPADALNRPWGREHLTGTEALEHCDACGAAVLQATAARRKHTYCSSACRVQIYRDAARVEPTEHPCHWCGTMIGGRADRKFCSPRCRTAAHRHTSADPASAARR